MSDFLFTSESVSEGHPDKVADQISDAMLDAILAQDQRCARRRRNAGQATGLVVLAGEITTNAQVNYIEVARDDHQAHRLRRLRRSASTTRTCAVLVAYDKQSSDIAQGVDQGSGSTSTRAPATRA